MKMRGFLPNLQPWSNIRFIAISIMVQWETDTEFVFGESLSLPISKRRAVQLLDVKLDSSLLLYSPMWKFNKTGRVIVFS